MLNVSLLVYGLSNIGGTFPRPIFVNFASTLLVAQGLFWYITRSFVRFRRRPRAGQQLRGVQEI
ncbi:MAG TPA: hypothetical protein VMU59_00425 [Caulobacteraceae bacterium]|nr:hypothetical protein [Caulobacteraceae bacterium]